ncbi:60S ribosomal protein L24-A [Wickerhamomyces ciferrii]|uniref:60S ribosomal protein L24-A n=1 Tax=Wickerhamomyces ciferrii (strain ATCC 14091 / BCRC 22168 / CBS 111 / JCM 3599 / NBRC 0793 / NRRL Y-1031 F-60-10) TaxID=1206466 RepID=K0KP39_WICCF|nr:60S ribosomal protein L24-A [Wickerhamomyces ciferrii]CCH43154.1 60S ribosomal protein L24-A [Wickerhamomyces ciferrii]
MKVEVDSFSGSKIYPGRGTLFVRGDSKIFRFQNSKSASLFHQRKNPRRISWTVLYRRQHKKGITEEVAKKRSRKSVKNQRAVVGASLELIKERRGQKADFRKAQREAAVKADKEKKKAAKASRKAEKAKLAGAQGQAAKISKQQAKGAFQKVAATSR